MKPKSKRAAQASALNQEESVTRASGDRKTDPLFVPHLEKLEIQSDGAEAGADEYKAILESICGTVDDSQPVEQYDGTLGVTIQFVATHQSAACQVQWNDNLASIYTNPGNVSGVRWGSGTMIGDDIFLTCGHLFDQTGGGWNRPRENNTTNIISPQEIARNMRLNFNFQVDANGNLRPEQSFPILELLEYRLGGLDMAVCRIGGNPGATFGRATVSTTDAARPDMICIIGHPAGQPKRVEAGPTTEIDGNLIRYNDIDTLGGNSGSGILRARDGLLVGIHTNGGCNAASPGEEGGSNFGQRIEAVIAISPTLQRIVNPAPPKLKFRDDVGKLKFRDDLPPPKSKIRDDIGKLKFRDDLPPPKRKFTDDVKFPALDKPPAIDVKAPAFDIPLIGGPRPGPRPGEAFRGGARPFILSTPHHSNAWQGGAGGVEQYAAELESYLAQIEQSIQAAEAQIAQAENEYRQVLAEYQQLQSQMSGGHGI